ncbi:MAG TPA: phage holin family protein [Actinomycetota bacterium]|nr:phage holin family protein [Actinomycetota bacterium]
MRQVDTHDGYTDKSLGELLKQLSQETTTLVKQELELAKAEISEKGKQAGVGVGLFGAAGIVGFLALASLTAFFVLALHAAGLPAWAAALVVAAVYGVVAAVLGLQGKEKVQEASPPIPEQTVETVKEDIQWARNQTR